VDVLLTDADIVTMAAGTGPAASASADPASASPASTGPADTGLAGDGPAPGAARSMLIRDDRIVAVGPAERVRAAAAPGARVVRLDGAAIVPGLIDAHCHLCDVGYLASGADCSQPAAPDIPAIQARLRDAAARTPPESWVTGSGYVEYKLRERRHPTRADLDAAVPGRPAILFHTSLHACVLNTPALREAGLDDRQRDPPDGHYGRDPEGRLDGVVHEGPTFTLLWGGLGRDMARMDAAARAQLITRAGRHFAALGVTAACDADTRRASLTGYAEADEQAALPVRIAGLVVHDEADWLLGSGLRGRRSPRLTADSVKIWADGGMSSRTAAIHGSYPVPPYGSGILYFAPDELTAMVREFDASGLQVCIHAQGDRAIETVLDSYAAVLGSRSGNPLRHRIEHGGSLFGPLAARAAALGIVVAAQPGMLSILGDGFAEALPERSDELFGYASWRRAGIRVAGSSDAPVITADPLVGIRDAVLRRTASGRVLGPAERLAVRDALALYTTQAAVAMRRERELGSLEPGKLADFVVLDRSPLAVPPEQLTGIRVLATVVGGQPVFQAGDSPVRL
jgi:predicted amidohydrolase YtcJ